MKTIQMTIDEELLCRVDDVTKELGVNRSAFLREALAEKLHRFHVEKLEQQHIAGYLRHPQDPLEVEEWAAAQYWGGV